MKILITGSLGLIGFTASQYFLGKNHTVVGIDNDMRSQFFGKSGSTKHQLKKLSAQKKYTHYSFDIRNVVKVEETLKKEKPDVIIHTAAQPSHDKAKEIPVVDYEINSTATLNLLEATKNIVPEAVFIFTSTNKVYGDTPNSVSLTENKSRYEFSNPKFKGFDESTSIDQSLHSLFGASKLSADIYVQEYGKYFGLKTTVLRLGCITGKAHAGVKLHGFLAYLVNSIKKDKKYTIIGHKGKQVRDQLHAFDLATAFEQIINNPKIGTVYNLGGGPKNTISVLEAIEKVSKKLNIEPKISYSKSSRLGDHICYISDIKKFQKDYPKWKITFSIDEILDELIHE